MCGPGHEPLATTLVAMIEYKVDVGLFCGQGGCRSMEGRYHSMCLCRGKDRSEERTTRKDW